MMNSEDILMKSLTWLAKHLLLQSRHREKGRHLGEHGEGGGVRVLVLREVALGRKNRSREQGAGSGEQLNRVQVPGTPTWGVLGGVGGCW